MARTTPAKVGVRVNLGVLELSGEWEPNNAERDAACGVPNLLGTIPTPPLPSRDTAPSPGGPTAGPDPGPEPRE